MLTGYEHRIPLSHAEQNCLEKNIYSTLVIPDHTKLATIDINVIKGRMHDVFIDYDFNIPQAIFYIRDFMGQVVVGRKIWSVLSQQNKINAPHCSMITSSMLFGILKSETYLDRKISIAFYPFTNEEKLSIFQELVNCRDYDISYPFTFKAYDTNKEKISPITGWKLNKDKVIYLGYGEQHLREFTLDYLKNIDLNGKLIYDPACSTGEFLYSIKQQNTNCITIGHDLSNEMIEYAKTRLDHSLCVNAFDSPVNKGSIDILVLRFLNSEVVSKQDALKLFKILKDKVKKMGYIICFGHTPVLLDKKTFIDSELDVIVSNGYSNTYNAIFQYYILRVK